MDARDSSESALLISVLWGGLPKYSFHAQNCPLFVFMGFVEFRARSGGNIEMQSVNVSFWDIREKILWWVGHKTTI